MRPGPAGRLLTALVALALVGYPLAELVRASVAGPPGSSASAAWASVGSGTVVEGILHTLAVSALATLAATALGGAMAVLAERSDLPARGALGGLFLAPLVVPPYVGGLSWLEAYGGAGLSKQWTGLSLGWVSGPAGVTLLLALEGCPLAYLLVRGVLSGQRSLELEEAARAAGAAPGWVVAEVTLPLLRPALVASALLVFVASASDFGIPAVLGIPAGFSTVTTQIYGDLSFAGGADAIGSATALSTLLGLLAVVVLLVAGHFLGEANPLSGGLAGRQRGGRAGTPSRRPLLALGRLRAPLALTLWVFVAVTVALPVLALLLEALGNGFQLSLWPGHWRAASFAAALSGGDLAALGRSLLLAGAAAALVATGGAGIAYVVRRGGRPMRLAGAAMTLPFALPGSVMAIAVLLAWERLLYGSLLIILLAYLARFAVIGLRSADAGLAGLGDELVDAGRAAGGRGHQVLRQVVLPSLAPSMWASFGLVFLLAVHELTMSSLLYGPSTATFAVTVLDAEQAGELSLTAALALVVTAVSLASALLLVALRRRAAHTPGGPSAPAAAGGLAGAPRLMSGP